MQIRKISSCDYRMFEAFDFCIPTRGANVPAGPDWIKVKNRKHPAMERVMDSFR